MYNLVIFEVPNTAYLKLIDYWNLFALMVTLANFFTLFLWEVGTEKQVHTNWKVVKAYMKIGLPLTTLLGVLTYWTVAVFIYL